MEESAERLLFDMCELESRRVLVLQSHLSRGENCKWKMHILFLKINFGSP